MEVVKQALILLLIVPGPVVLLRLHRLCIVVGPGHVQLVDGALHPVDIAVHRLKGAFFQLGGLVDLLDTAVQLPVYLVDFLDFVLNVQLVLDD